MFSKNENSTIHDRKNRSETLYQLLERFPLEQWWRLFIDGFAQYSLINLTRKNKPGRGFKEMYFPACESFDQGKGPSDEYETGYMELSLYTFFSLIDDINAPLTLDIIKNTHHKLTSNLRYRDDLTNLDDRYNPGKVRDEKKLLGFNLYDKKTSAISITKNGCIELKEQQHELSFAYLEFPENPVVKLNPYPVSVIEKKISDIVTFYENQIASETDIIKKITIITNTIQKLVRLHPFSDGNGRTFCMQILNRELLRHNMYPVILSNPNTFRGFSLNEMVQEVIAGQERFKHILDNKDNNDATLTFKLGLYPEIVQYLHEKIPPLIRLNVNEKKASLYFVGQALTKLNSLSQTTEKQQYEEILSNCLLKAKQSMTQLFPNEEQELIQAIYQHHDKGIITNLLNIHPHLKDKKIAKPLSYISYSSNKTPKSVMQEILTYCKSDGPEIIRQCYSTDELHKSLDTKFSSKTLKLLIKHNLLPSTSLSQYENGLKKTLNKSEWYHGWDRNYYKMIKSYLDVIEKEDGKLNTIKYLLMNQKEKETNIFYSLHSLGLSDNNLLKLMEDKEFVNFCLSSITDNNISSFVNKFPDAIQYKFLLAIKNQDNIIPIIHNLVCNHLEKLSDNSEQKVLHALILRLQLESLSPKDSELSSEDRKKKQYCQEKIASFTKSLNGKELSKLTAYLPDAERLSIYEQNKSLSNQYYFNNTSHALQGGLFSLSRPICSRATNQSQPQDRYSNHPKIT